MSERLIVKNFLGLKDIDMEVKDINILIGPQSEGKSVCAKLLYLFKSSFHVFYNLNTINLTKPQFNTYLTQEFYKYFPKQFLGKSEFKIRYEIGGAFIEINTKNDKKHSIEISYSKIFINLREAFKKEFKKSQDKAKDINPYQVRQDQTVQPFIKILEDIKSKLDSTAGFYQIFIPAGRLFFSSLDVIVYTLIKNNIALDPVLLNFNDLYIQLKNTYIKLREQKEPYKQIKTILDQLLSGTYINNSGADYINLNDGRKISVVNASSGQQAVLPLTIILDSFIKHILPESNTLYIEEPEAHLFPTSQKHIVALISSTYNLSKSPLQFFITTHSPYILTSFNNLIKAGILKKKLPPDKLKELYKIVSKEQVIDPEKVAVYTLKDGKLIDLINKNYKIIDANSIDDVSNELGETFGSLLDMEYK